MARYSVDYDGNLETTDDRVSYGSFDAAVGGINDRGFESYGVQDNRRGGGGNLGSFGIGGQDTPGGRAGAGWSALNEARQVRGGGLGGLFGGFTPGRAIGGLLGGLIAGPIGGLVGAGIGGGMGGGRGGWGYTDAQGNQVSAGRDMIDGGGPGRSGDRFEGGGLLSAVGNTLGIRPAGYRDRQAMQSQMSADQVRAGIGSAGGIPPVGVTDLTGTSANVAPVSQPVTPQAMGQTMRPGLTAEDLARLQAMGLGQGALVGEQPTAQEMAALIRGPGMLMNFNNPSARPYAPQQPGMDVSVATGMVSPSANITPSVSGVNVGLSDLGTTLPHVSRVPPAMPSAGAMPSVDTQTYRDFPSAMPVTPAFGQYNPVFSGFNVMPGVRIGGTDPITMINPVRAGSLAMQRSVSSVGTAPYADTQTYRGNVIRRVYNN